VIFSQRSLRSKVRKENLKNLAVLAALRENNPNHGILVTLKSDKIQTEGETI
jgi:hypothetical protein